MCSERVENIVGKEENDNNQKFFYFFKYMYYMHHLSDIYPFPINYWNQCFYASTI